MITDKRFENHVRRYGFKIRDVRGTRDLKSVSFKGFHLFTIPAKMYSHPIENYTVPGPEIRHPSYHELTAKARWYWWRIKQSPWFSEMRQEACKQKYNPKEYEI